jgi:hypothetical protein
VVATKHPRKAVVAVIRQKRVPAEEIKERKKVPVAAIKHPRKAAAAVIRQKRAPAAAIKRVHKRPPRVSVVKPSAALTRSNN